jgi:hypothetical protein
MDYDEYNAAILKAGDLTMTINKKKFKWWFQLQCATLTPLLSSHAIRQASHLPQSVQSTMQADL